MPASKSEQRSFQADERAVSEVIGFITTFAIVAALLLVAMLSFNDAQGRATERVAELQANSAAQRIAATALDIALLGPGADTTLSVAVELPLDIAGSGYLVKLCQDDSGPVNEEDCGDPGDWCNTNPCPYVRVDPRGGDPQRQSTFLTGGVPFCTNDTTSNPTFLGDEFIVNGGTVYVTYVTPPSLAPCIGLSNVPV